MKIVVMSDSHGKLGNLIDIGLMHKNADAFLFLGDGCAVGVVRVKKQGKRGRKKRLQRSLVASL